MSASEGDAANGLVEDDAAMDAAERLAEEDAAKQLAEEGHAKGIVEEYREISRIPGIEERFEAFSEVNAMHMEDFQQSLRKILDALTVTHEASRRPPLQRGYIDKNGRCVPTPNAFYYLKDPLTFFITPDLPFRLPPCDFKLPVRLRNFGQLRTAPVGTIIDTASTTDTDRMLVGRTARALFQQGGTNRAKPELFTVYADHQGIPIKEQDILLWYTEAELQELGKKCVEAYENALKAEDTRFLAAHREWADKCKRWEWQVFCLARRHYAAVHWSFAADYDVIMVAEEHTGMLDKGRMKGPEMDIFVADKF